VARVAVTNMSIVESQIESFHNHILKHCTTLKISKWFRRNSAPISWTVKKVFPFYPGAGQNSLNGDDGGEEGGEEFISRSVFFNVFLIRKIMKWGMRKGGKSKRKWKRKD
jgi:hypothetical protein